MAPGFRALLDRFCAAVEAGDGKAFARLFTPDGVYDDVFYGTFHGRREIAGMLEGLFYRDGEDFLWRMLDPVDDGRVGYARWRFSYTCRLSHVYGKRIFMDGVGRFRLQQGLIARYTDIARTAELLHQMELPAGKRAAVAEKMLGRQMADSAWTEHRRG